MDIETINVEQELVEKRKEVRSWWERISKQDMEKINKQISTLRHDFFKVKRENRELREKNNKFEERKIFYEKIENDYKYLKEQTQELIEKNKLLQKELEEKQNIIKIQSVNNRVLLEEIIRVREGKK